MIVFDLCRSREQLGYSGEGRAASANSSLPLDWSATTMGRQQPIRQQQRRRRRWLSRRLSMARAPHANLCAGEDDWCDDTQ